MTERWTVVRLLETTAAYLAEKGVDSPRLDAELLLGQILDLSRVQLYLQHDRPLSEEELTAYRAPVRRRAAREPVQYILGETEFWSLPFTVTPAVLIPRPDTEVLVEEALARGTDGARVLDVGTGSGAIAIALAHEWPQAQVTGIDLSPEALAVAQGNAARNGVADRTLWQQGDLQQLPAGPWDLLVSNPPYIAAAEMPTLMPEVRDYEPQLALAVPGDGLDSYRALCRQAPAVLAPGGWLLVEVGIGQAQGVQALMADNGLQELACRKDYAGIDRVVCGRAPQENDR